VVLGSAGGPRQALDIIGADHFLIVNGDTLTDLDVGALGAAHETSRASVTLALTSNPDPSRYGGVLLEGDRVVGFVPPGQETRSYHFIGVQLAAAEVFRPLPPGRILSSIGGVYDDLIASRAGSVRGFVTSADFRDIGTIADYWTTSRALSTNDGSSALTAGRQTAIDPTSHVSDSILWDRVMIGARATVDQCIVTDGVDVPAGSVHRRMVLVQTASGLEATPFDVPPHPEER
jgi:mannose-1-phosphate guanylyltransferase